MNKFLDYVKSQDGWPAPGILELRSQEWIRQYNLHVPLPKRGTIGIPSFLAVGKSLEECQKFYSTSLFPNALMAWVMYETRPPEPGENRFTSPQIVPDFMLGMLLSRVEDFYGNLSDWEKHLDLRSLHFLIEQTAALLKYVNIKSAHRKVGEWESRSLPEFIRTCCYDYGRIVRNHFIDILNKETSK